MPRDFQPTASFGLRRLVAIGGMVLFAMLAIIPASAQDLDPNSPPPARDYVSCGHFETQADAQEVLDSGNLDDLGRQSLDGDGDGIACEDAFGTTEPATDMEQEATGVVRLPNTGEGVVETPANGGLLASLMLSAAMMLLSRRLARAEVSPVARVLPTRSLPIVVRFPGRRSSGSGTVRDQR